MKIAYVFDVLYPWVRGGVQKRIYEIGRRLAKEEHEIHIFGLQWWNGDTVYQQEGMWLHGIYSAQKFYLQNGVRNTRTTVGFSISLIKELFKYKFDLVECQSTPYLPAFVCWFYSRLTRIPLVIYWIEVMAKRWKEFLGCWIWVGNIIEWLCARLTPFIVTNSETTRQRMKQYLGIWTKFDAIPFGVDVCKIDSVESNRSFKKIVSVGRLFSYKKPDIVLRIMSEVHNSISDISLIIIGDGPEKDNLKKLAIELGISANIEWFHNLSDDELIYYLKSSSILLSTSLYEGQGIVYLEAMACGTVVVTVESPTNAAKEFIHSGANGILISGLDIHPQLIAKTLVNLLQNPLELEILSKKAYKWVSTFYDLDKVTIPRTLEFYKLAIQ